MKRIRALKNLAFTPDGYDGYLLFNETNQLYFTGSHGTAALLVPADGEDTAYVYSVNYEQAKAEAQDVNLQLVKADENLLAKIAGQAQTQGIRKLAVDVLGVETWQALTNQLPSTCTIEVTNRFPQQLRMVKDAEEIQRMRQAAELTSRGMEAAGEAVKAGAREFEVAAEIEYAMRMRGSGPPAFETIVASGLNSAYPHSLCASRTIRNGDLVVVDIGATYNCYCSDMTRTLVAGKPTEKQQKMYAIVKEAQEKALQIAQAGVPIADVDAAARKTIAAAGYGDYFVHRLGHGVGLEVHEPPNLNSANPDCLEVGNVVTIEPGIYLVGFGGVRIEDTVLIQKEGAEKLTSGNCSLSV